MIKMVLMFRWTNIQTVVSYCEEKEGDAERPDRDHCIQMKRVNWMLKQFINNKNGQCCEDVEDFPTLFSAPLRRHTNFCGSGNWQR